MSTFLVKSVLASGLMALASAGSAQVTYLRNVPTVQELKAALAQAPAAPAGRGVEFTAPPQAAALTVSALPAPAGAAATACRRATAGPAVAMPIHFDVNSSRLAGPSVGFVDAVASLMAQDPSLRLLIEGHTDANGNASRNLMLSWERAMVVFRTLVDKHGVDPQRLEPLGRGSLEPLEGMDPAAAVNRRVQFRVSLAERSTVHGQPS